MSALTLVMKELLDMNAEEFLNVRAYHSTGRSFKQVVNAAEALSTPSSNDTSGFSSLTSSNSEEEPTSSPSSTSSSPTHTAPKKTVLANLGIKESKCAKKIFPKNGKQEPLKDEKIDIKIIYGGRNILNLERNLVLYQWQLRSPLANTYAGGYANQLSSFRYVKDSGALEELTNICEQCDFREPIQF